VVGPRHLEVSRVRGAASTDSVGATEGVVPTEIVHEAVLHVKGRSWWNPRALRGALRGALQRALKVHLRALGFIVRTSNVRVHSHTTHNICDL
jgi:hypothetical protein